MRTRTGASRRSFFRLSAAALLIPFASGGDKDEAVVAGTVFRDPGFAFPGVEVTLTPVNLPPGVKKLKPMRAVTNTRGEYAFRVPAGQARYTVAATAKGFDPAEKQADVAAGERIDVYLTLKPSAR